MINGRPALPNYRCFCVYWHNLKTHRLCHLKNWHILSSSKIQPKCFTPQCLWYEYEGASVGRASKVFSQGDFLAASNELM